MLTFTILPITLKHLFYLLRVFGIWILKQHLLAACADLNLLTHHSKAPVLSFKSYWNLDSQTPLSCLMLTLTFLSITLKHLSYLFFSYWNLDPLTPLNCLCLSWHFSSSIFPFKSNWNLDPLIPVPTLKIWNCEVSYGSIAPYNLVYSGLWGGCEEEFWRENAKSRRIL